MIRPKFLQVIPADGWTAVYSYRWGEGNLEIYELRVVSWTLASKEYRGGKTDRVVIGLVVSGRSGIHPADDAEDAAFVGYRHHSDPLSEWREDAERAARTLERREAEEERLRAARFQYRLDEYECVVWHDPQTGRLLRHGQALDMLRERAA